MFQQKLFLHFVSNKVRIGNYNGYDCSVSLRCNPIVWLNDLYYIKFTFHFNVMCCNGLLLIAIILDWQKQCLHQFPCSIAVQKSCMGFMFALEVNKLVMLFAQQIFLHQSYADMQDWQQLLDKTDYLVKALSLELCELLL